MRSLPILPLPGARTSIRSAVFHLLVFAAGVVGFGQVVRGALLLDPEVGSEQSRLALLLLRHFDSGKDEFDVVFVGSSRFQRSIDPAVFDRHASLGNQDLRSFNYSMVGMRMPEIMARVDWILEQEPRKLRWLFVELTSLDPRLRFENRRGRRMISWHTPRATIDCLRVIAASSRTPRAKLDAALPHLAEFAYRSTNVGLGPEALERRLGTASHGPQLAYFDGYESDEEEARRKRRGRRIEEAADSTSQRSPTSTPDPTPEPATAPELEDRSPPATQPAQSALEPESPAYSEGEDEFPDEQARVLAAFIERVESAGVELIFVRPPRSPRDRTSARASRSGMLPKLFVYNAVEPYAYLYDGALKRDLAHLNTAGAAVFSKLLATDFLQYVAERENERAD